MTSRRPYWCFKTTKQWPLWWPLHVIIELPFYIQAVDDFRRRFSSFKFFAYYEYKWSQSIQGWLNKLCHQGTSAKVLVYQENPVGVELLSYVKVFFFPRYFHRCWLREWKCSINSVLIREKPRILRKNKANRAALVSFFKIMLKKLRLLPEISINYKSDIIWANGISYFLTTKRCLWTLR